MNVSELQLFFQHFLLSPANGNIVHYGEYGGGGGGLWVDEETYLNIDQIITRTKGDHGPYGQGGDGKYFRGKDYGKDSRSGVVVFELDFST